MWSTFTAGLQMVQEKLLEGEHEEKGQVRFFKIRDSRFPGFRSLLVLHHTKIMMHLP